MRKVHDIWRTKRGAGIAFIQHGNRDILGWLYEVICPYCAKTVGWVSDVEDTLNNQQLWRSMAFSMKKHIEKCQFPGASTLAVEITQEALHTDENLPRVM
jgi:hypothetical protein